MEHTLVDLSSGVEAAVIVGVELQQDDHFQVEEDLIELESLLETLGISVTGRILQKRVKLIASHLLGSGKIEEVRQLAEETGAKLVVVDHELTGPQIRNIEKMTNCQVLDRAGIILDIFARHAKTNQAKTQVEIAQLEYLLPRLTGAWTHFQRQSGGGVRSRGMGEKQIEIDRRRARERIARLHKRLETIKKERETQRKSRQNELKVAVVGYTNSGKTTVMKALTKATQEGKDELFATLDSSVRTIDPNTRPKILLSDTVGFIRNLPHSLIDSFKSTLEEVLDADLLLHIVDIAHPNYTAQKEVTEQVLEEIGAGDIPQILIFNKSDKVDDPFLGKILRANYKDSILVSAYKSDDMAKLRSHLFEIFETQFQQVKLQIEPDDQQTLSLIHRTCVILDADYETEGKVVFTVRAPANTVAKLRRFNVDSLESFE